MQCEHVLQSTMYPSGLESEFGSAPVSESGNVTKPVINFLKTFFGGHQSFLWDY